MIKTLMRKAYGGVLYAIRGPESLKAFHEMRQWRAYFAKERVLRNERDFEDLYTTVFSLDKTFYVGKKILDVGCGPRGSLEWADMASVRIGLDSLASQYREFGTGSHKMGYVSAYAEQIPFPDECFDVLSSFFSLKHVIRIDQAINEIIRTMDRGGILLLQTGINNRPNRREPTKITWDIVEGFLSNLKLVEGHYRDNTTGVTQEWIPYAHSNELWRPVSLTAKFIKQCSGPESRTTRLHRPGVGLRVPQTGTDHLASVTVRQQKHAFDPHVPWLEAKNLVA